MDNEIAFPCIYTRTSGAKIVCHCPDELDDEIEQDSKSLSRGVLVIVFLAIVAAALLY